MNEINEIRSKIVKFNQSKEFEKLSNYFEYRSFYEILSISRKESTHTSFISWLLTPNESHGLSDFALRKFLECILMVLNDGKQKTILTSLDVNFINAVITGNYELENIKIVKEKSLPNSRRLDIYVESDIIFGTSKKKINLVIENKVKSEESSEQTIDYYDWLNNNFSNNLDFINLPIYLTPIDNNTLLSLEEPLCSSKKFIQINYQYLLDYMFQPSLDKDLSDQSKFLLKDYIKNLNTNSEGLIMAISAEEKELLKVFWEKNKDLIKSAMNVIKDNNDIPEEESQIIKAFLDLDSPNSRDLSRYTFNNITNYNKGTLVNAVLKKYVECNPNVSFAQLKEVFGENVCNTLEFATEIFNRTGYKRHRLDANDLIILSDSTKIVTSTQWDRNNILNFITKAKSCLTLEKYFI